MMKRFTIGSFFDGSGGFPLAASMCGGVPVWASEIEPYPIAVTRSRFPRMVHLGDISKINGAEIEPVDVITFGSPCQDMSVAGKRAGLKHEDIGDEETTRSGLFMEAVRVAIEMRRATNGKYPKFMLWENVPGAFSSNKGEDFRIVLEELIKIVEPYAVMPSVPSGGWAYADCYVGDGWSLAYRVFDAQYWGRTVRSRDTGVILRRGTPQRRRRIHLILDLTGGRAGEILFERGGVRGYFETGRTPWQGITTDAERSIGADDRTGECVVCMATQQGGAEIRTDNKAPTVTAAAGMSGNNQPVVCYGISSYQSNSMLSDNPHSGIYEATTSRTFDLNGGNPACNQGGICVVAYAMQAFEAYKDCGVASGLKARDYKDATDLVVGMDCRNGKLNGDLCGTLQAKPNGGFSYNCIHPVIIRQPTRYIVRRLTPTECARLQGFPDEWGHPDHKESLTNDEYAFWMGVRNTHAAINGKAEKQYTREQMLRWYNGLHTDSAEYKMWGNGIALPPALYCMQGIAEALRQKQAEEI